MSVVCFIVSCQADKAALQILGDFQPIRPMAALKIILFFFTDSYVSLGFVYTYDFAARFELFLHGLTPQ
jgi:hypothetical protein